MPSIPPRNKTLVLVVKIHTKADIKIFCSCPSSSLFHIFFSMIVGQTFMHLYIKLLKKIKFWQIYMQINSTSFFENMVHCYGIMLKRHFSWLLHHLRLMGHLVQVLYLRNLLLEVGKSSGVVKPLDVLPPQVQWTQHCSVDIQSTSDWLLASSSLVPKKHRQLPPTSVLTGHFL